MNTPIKTNEIKYTLNFDRLNQYYEVYKITTTEKYFSDSSYMFDSPLLCDNICSLVYESEKCIFVLMRKGIGNRQKLRDTLSELSDYSSITISAEHIPSVQPYLILQLLLNSIGSYSNILKVNNLTGHFYCFHPKWIEHISKPNESFISKIPTLEIRILPENKLILNVRTFTSIKLKNFIKFENKPIESYPQYVFSANNTLRRKLKTDTDSGFILRQTDGDKTEIPFLNLQSYDKFSKTKMGVLCDILDKFNAKFEGIAKIEFKAINEYTSIDVKSSSKMLKEIKPIVHNYLLKNKVKIVDRIGNENSAICCKKISEILKSEYDVEIRCGHRIDKSALNICLIHNAQYYIRYEIDDPHDKVYDGTVVQHITLEDFNFDAVCAIRTVVQELLIKQDILSKKINLYDWSSLKFENKTAFMMSSTDKNKNSHYFCMEIAPDGSFSISEKKLNLFEFEEYSECVDIFENDDLKKSIRGIVKFSNGDINIIRDSSLFMVPELELIKNELQSGNNYLRNRKTRDSLLTSILDIKGYNKDGKMYYFAGVIGEGMQAKIERAVNIREIQPYNNSKLFFEKLLPLMNVNFVRNGQLTVIPFPFKYLREYVKLKENKKL